VKRWQPAHHLTLEGRGRLRKQPGEGGSADVRH
jgi:hypothetical protein